MPVFSKIEEEEFKSPVLDMKKIKKEFDPKTASLYELLEKAFEMAEKEYDFMKKIEERKLNRMRTLEMKMQQIQRSFTQPVLAPQQP